MDNLRTKLSNRFCCLGIIAALAAVLCSGFAVAQTIENGHCYGGCPDGAGLNNHLIIRPAFTLSFNSEANSADWVAYTVSANSVGIASSLDRTVKVDNVVLDTLAQQDFEGQSQLEMARYVPLVDFAGTPFWEDLNYSTNFAPRTAGLNQGAWYGLSWAIRNAVNRLGELYVVTGPIYEETVEPSILLTEKQHKVPSAFFKVVIDREGRQSVFVLPQATPVHVHHCNLESDMATIERLTGLTILPKLKTSSTDTITASLGCF